MTDETNALVPIEPLDPDTADPAAPAMYTEGGRSGPGRPKGALNRTTLLMKEAIASVFEDLQKRVKGPGRFPAFLAWAEKNETEFYKMAERRLRADGDAAGQAIGVVIFKGMNDDDDA